MKKLYRKKYLALAIALFASGCQQSVESTSTNQQANQQNQKLQPSQKIQHSTEATDALNLQVPSPDWREQVIYFAMIDRFNDGDKSNNDQGVGVYNPAIESHYSGGDIKGVTQQIDYLESLGATAVWLTPHVANQWWHKEGNFGGYHGYWARDFKKVDEHYGTLADYQKLSSALHNKGMYLIQDIVANHTGNYIQYDGEYDPSDTAKNFKIFDAQIASQKVADQYPFNLVDRNNPEHVKADIYHWTPPISDFKDPVQEYTYQLANLADLNTSNPLVRETLKDSYNYWLEQAGVDAFRVDTVKYVEHEFWHDFFHSDNGIFPKAKSLGKNNFLAFGEVFDASAPYQNEGEHKLASFLGSKAKPELNSVIGFPLYFELNRVFAEGQPSEQLAYRLEQHMTVYPDPYVIPNFVNNHDTPRFLQFGNLKGFKQAQATVFTIPGIPVIYQGDEQGLDVTRQAMFEEGYHSTESQFKQDSEMFKYISKLAKLRKENKALVYGDLNIVASDKSGAGVLAYTRQYQDEIALVVLNTTDSSRLLSNLNLAKLNLGNNAASLTLAMQEEFTKAKTQLTLSAHQQPTMSLPGRSILIYTGKVEANEAVLEDNAVNQTVLTLDQVIEGQVFNQSQKLTGTLTQGGSAQVNSPLANTELKLIINGDIDNAIDFTTNANGKFNVTLPVEDYGRFAQSFVIYAPAQNYVSERFDYVAEYLKADITRTVVDSDHDGYGPTGSYQSPTQELSGKQREITAAEVKTAGGNLELTISMAEISDVWGGPNGFDNVSFAIFVDVPFKQGKKHLPMLNADMPFDLKWRFGHSFFGWGNTLFTSVGATAEKEGYKLALAPSIQVDKTNNTITIGYQGKAIGIDNWQGASLYITTWDKSGEGHLRELTEQPSAWTFSGGGHKDPKIMDSLLIRVE